MCVHGPTVMKNEGEPTRQIPSQLYGSRREPDYSLPPPFLLSTRYSLERLAAGVPKVPLLFFPIRNQIFGGPTVCIRILLTLPLLPHVICRFVFLSRNRAPREAPRDAHCKRHALRSTYPSKVFLNTRPSAVRRAIPSVVST